MADLIIDDVVKVYRENAETSMIIKNAGVSCKTFRFSDENTSSLYERVSLSALVNSYESWPVWNKEITGDNIIYSGQTILATDIKPLGHRYILEIEYPQGKVNAIEFMHSLPFGQKEKISIKISEESNVLAISDFMITENISILTDISYGDVSSNIFLSIYIL